MRTETRKTVNQILGSTLFGVVNELVQAKENGSSLPGTLDAVASIAIDARNQGFNFAQEEAKKEVFKYLPWAIVGILIIFIIVKIKT